MRKRLLIGTGAIAALVVGAKMRSRTTSVAPPLAIVGTCANPIGRQGRGSNRFKWLLLHLFAISRLAWPWDPVVDVWNGVSGAVKELVRSVANEIYGYIAQGFQWMWDLWEAAKRTSNIIWNNLFEYARTLVDGVKNWFNEVIRFTYAILDEGIKRVRNYAIELFNQAMGYAGIILQDLIKFVGERVQWVYDKWIAPLIDFVWGIIRMIGEEIQKAINWINANLIQPVWNFARDVWRYVEQLWDWFIRTARNAVEMVLKASWLLILAISYGPEFWISWVSEQINRLPAVIVGMAENAVSKEGSRIENWVVRWLGI